VQQAIIVTTIISLVLFIETFTSLFSTMASTQNANGIKKIVQLFKSARRAPPPRYGDGKYDSEEDDATLKAGIVKDLAGSKKTIPRDLDLILQFIKAAKAGGNKASPSEVRPACYSHCRLNEWLNSLLCFQRATPRRN
jgi:hypothetical protein